MFARYCAPRQLHTVLAGAAVGRSIRFKGLRHAPRSLPNWPASVADQLFMDEQTVKDLYKKLLIHLNQYLFCNQVTSPKMVKTNHMGKQRVVVDPTSVGTNQFILKHEMRFAKFAELVKLVLRFGPGTIVLVFDVGTAYKTIAVAAVDLHLHGEWDDKQGHLLQTMQQWGVASAGFKWLDKGLLFAQILVTTLLLFIVLFVDDFATPIPPFDDGTPDQAAADEAVRDISAIALILGVELKKWQMGTHVKYLGYVLDTRRMTVNLPFSWLMSLHQKIRSDGDRMSITVKSLHSTAGKLARFITVAPLGRIHTRSTYAALAMRRNAGKTALVRLSAQVKEDWSELLILIERAMGKKPTEHLSIVPTNIHKATIVYTDASGKFKAFIAPALARWAAHQWTQREIAYFTRALALSMPAMEAAAIFDAIVWIISIRPCVGPILIRTDSEVSILALVKGGSPSPVFDRIIRAIIRTCARYPYPINFHYVHTKSNPADLPTRLTHNLLQECVVVADGKRCLRTGPSFRTWRPASKNC